MARRNVGEMELLLLTQWSENGEGRRDVKVFAYPTGFKKKFWATKSTVGHRQKQLSLSSP